MITVVGEALVDLVVTADGAITATSGGAPFNVARACARLGMPVSLVAAVSTDHFGERLMADLAADGVRTDSVQRVERPTTLAFATLDRNGIATYRFYLEGTSAVALKTAPLPARTRAVVVGGLGLIVEPMAPVVERMVRHAADDVLVLVDLNCRSGAVGDRARYVARLGRVIARADVIKASVEDLCYLDATAPPVEVAARLVAAGPRAALVTAGADDTTVVTKAATKSVPVIDRPVVDTIGAGDAFTAGFLTWWLARSRTIEGLADVDSVVVPAVKAAHQVASVVLGRRGADPPHRHEVPSGWGSID